MYEFYMDGVLLPVTPGALTIKIANQNKTINLINEGQVNIIKAPGLSKISFSALLPNQVYPFARYVNGYKPAQYYMSLLEKLKRECRPFPFYIIRATDNGELLMRTEGPMTVSLESYELAEDASSYGVDVMAKIELLQYRDYHTKTIEFKKSENSSTGNKTATVTQQRDTTTAPAGKTYTVKQGDTLWDIARVQLGNGSKWTTIYNLNKATIEAAAKKYGRSSSSNGWWIYPGTVLKLPS